MGKAGGKVASMTGFARAEGGDALYAWAWEIKSVNGRGLDLRWRLPPGFDALEPRLRPLIAKACKRGSLQVNLQMSVKSGGEALSLNRPLVDRILALQAELAKDPAAKDLAPMTMDGLFALRGVLESEKGEGEAEKEKRNKALEKDFRTTLEGLTAARARLISSMSPVSATTSVIALSWSSLFIRVSSCLHAGQAVIVSA